MNIETVGVVGAGTMGNGIAQVFAASGYRTIMVDVDDKALESGMTAIATSLERLVKKEGISASDSKATLAHISTSTTMNPLEDCEFVVEAVTENFGIKATILKALDEACDSDAIIASNTSSISLTRLAAQTDRPDKVIGMHFMNPVPVMELIEIIRALQTSDETCDITEGLSRNLGKTPVIANDSPGFVANRILLPMINEAIFTLHEGVADAGAIDEIMKLGMNHPIGPLALADLIGLDVVLSVLEVLQEGTGDPKFRPCTLLRKMVDANHLGRKTGKGFYDYG
jgi:3-hydroxybutyryl-CoA dehydrogenase